MAGGVIIGAKHMPAGGLQGGIGSVTASGLRAAPIQSAPARAGIPRDAVNDPPMGFDHDRRTAYGGKPLAVTIERN